MDIFLRKLFKHICNYRKILDVRAMPEQYVNDETLKMLSNVIDKSIEKMNKDIEPIEKPIFDLTSFIKILNDSQTNDNLLFLYSLTSFLSTMYGSVLTRIEYKRDMLVEDSRHPKEIEKIDKMIDEIKKNGKKIFLMTLENLGKVIENNNEMEVIMVLKKSHISMVMDIVDKYGYI
jgi:hypothetical protein